MKTYKELVEERSRLDEEIRRRRDAEGWESPTRLMEHDSISVEDLFEFRIAAVYPFERSVDVEVRRFR